MKGKTVCKKLYIFLSAIVLSLALFFLLLSNISKGVADQEFVSTTKYYNSNQYYITSASPANDTNVVPISTLYTNSSGTITKGSVPSDIANKTVSISTAIDLYAFSQLCLNDSNFLKYNYKLLNNIDYSLCTYQFAPIGLDSTAIEGDGFTGKFDGMGYEISNLQMTKISSANDIYKNMKYFGMFSHVGQGGVVSNFGLIDTSISIVVNSERSLIGVSTLAGKNDGEISYCFVKDTRSIEETGIYVVGGYQITGLVFTNTGNLHDCYVSYSQVVNYETTDYIDFNELLSNNTGIINNLFFYNSSIKTYNGTASTEDVEYNEAVGKKYLGRTKFGNYCGSLNDSSESSLVNQVMNTNTSSATGKWYSPASYGEIKDQIIISTPITRGITYNDQTKTFTVNNESDFCYMYELMNSNSYFATDVFTYSIACNINLSLVSEENYFYKSVISAKIIGVEGSYANGANLTNDSSQTVSKYPTIYYPALNKCVTIDGVESYGLFPYFAGELSNLNVIVKNKEFNKSTSNHLSIGCVAGYIDGGKVDNVNVLIDGKISLGSQISSKYYFGGIAGMISNHAMLSNVTVNGNLSDNTNSTVNQATGYDDGNSIGGIVGYITKSTANVNNALSKLNITENSTGTADLIVGGVIGSGYTRTVNDVFTSNLENRGNITITNTNASNLYVAGVVAKQLGMSHQVSGFNNVGTINVDKVGTNSSYISGVTNVALNVNSQLKTVGTYTYFASSFTNKADVLVNVSGNSVNYTMVCNIKNDSTKKYQSTVSGLYNLKAVTIDMSKFNSFAPVLNHIGGDSTHGINANTVYNLRDVSFNLNNDITTANTFTYTGCVLGNYINYNDVRNEGNLTFNFEKKISDASTIFNISGLFDVLTNNYTANILYNGGNIQINDNDTNEKKCSLYISGICRENNSILTDDKYNPLNANFDSTTLGSINNAINAGKIEYKSDYNETDTYDKASTQKNLKANFYIGGLVYLNKGIISNGFNLGNVNLKLFSKTTLNYYVGGIACYNNGEYAQIRDSANNGDLHCIDMASDKNSKIEVGGIVATNVNSSSNIKQVIAFTINYGEVIAFDASETISSPTENYDSTTVRGAGILSTGACNIVNVVNYANVYASEATGGLISLIDLSKFADANLTIANTINYGNILNCKRYYSNESSSVNNVQYNDVKEKLHCINGDPTNGPYCGALMTFFNFNNSNKIKVRYLINFFRNAPVVSSNINGSKIDVATFITSRGNVDSFGIDGNYVSYAPLTSVQDASGNVGAFSEKFVFRKAINGEGIDENIVTDKYIANYFQFVNFDKINDSLLDSIGWRTFAYETAADNFAQNLDVMEQLLTKTNTDLSEKAFESNTWIDNCDTSMVIDFIKKSVDTNKLNESNLKNILSYALFSDESKSSFSSEVKKSIINDVLNNLPTSTDYYELLNSLLYEDMVAKIITSETYEYSQVKEAIDSVIVKLTNEKQSEILDNYIKILEDEVSTSSSSSVLDVLFSTEYSSTYFNAKLELIDQLLSGYDEQSLEYIYSLLDSKASDSTIKYINYLKNNNTEAKDIYKHMIASNSFINNDAYLTYVNSILDKCNLSDELKDVNYTIDTSKYEDISSDKTKNGIGELLVPTLAAPTKDYTDLWNIIKNDPSIQQYISQNIANNIYDNPNTGKETGLLAQATEYKNSYQSNDKSQTELGINYNNTVNENYAGISYSAGMDENTIVRNRFVYTPDYAVSSATNFFGEYLSTGLPFDSPKENQNYLTANNRRYNLNYDLYGKITNATAGATRDCVPVFITTKESILSDKLKASNATNQKIYNFYFSLHTDLSKGLAWKNVQFLDIASSDTTDYMLRDQNSGDYIVDGYNFSPTLQTVKIKDLRAYDAKSSVEAYKGIGYNKNGDDNNHQHRDQYMVGYTSSAFITGVYYMLSCWNNSNKFLNSLFAKIENTGFDTNCYGVYTTNYTCYSLNDLIMLDGYRTKGYCSKETIDGNANGYYHMEDTNERVILSAVVTEILSTSDGQKLVLNALSNYSKENDFNQNQSNEAYILLDALKNNSFASSALVDNCSSILNFKYERTQTISEYLNSQKLQSSSYKELIEEATVSDLANFRILLTKLYRLQNDANVNHGEEMSLMYKYLQYLYSNNPNITDNEIDELLKNINNTNLNTNLKNLQSIFDSFVSDFNGSIETNNYKISNIYCNSKNDYLCIALDDSEFVNIDKAQTFYIKYKGTINNVSSDGSKFIEFTLAKNSSIDIEKDTKIYNVNLDEVTFNNVVTNVSSTSGIYSSSNEYSFSTNQSINNGSLTYSITGNGKGNNSSIEEGKNPGYYLKIDIPVSKNVSNLKLTINFTNCKSSVAYTKFTFDENEINNTEGYNKLDSESTNDYTITYGKSIPENEILSLYVSTIYCYNNTEVKTFQINSIKMQYDINVEYFNGTVVNNNILLNNNNTVNITSQDSATILYDNNNKVVNQSKTVMNISKIQYSKSKEIIQIAYDEAMSKVLTAINDNFDNIEYLKCYLKDVFIDITNNSTVSITQPSYVLVKAKNGSVKIGDTENTFENDSSYKGYYLTKGTYQIVNNGSIEKIYVVASNLVGSIETTGQNTKITVNNVDVFNGNYLKIKDFKLPNGYTYKKFYEAYPTYRTDATNNKALDMQMLIKTLWGTNKALENGLNNRIIFHNYSDEELKEIIELISVVDYNNSLDNDLTKPTLAKLLEKTTLDSKSQITNFENEAVVKVMAKKIIEIVGQDETSYPEISLLIQALYLGNDYLTSDYNTQSEIYSILKGYSNGEYQFINEDTTVDGDKFIALMNHLAGTSSVDLGGYGIFALSSSKGINDGIFIPDNLVLEEMDANYELNENEFELSENTSSNWRGGTVDNPKDTSDVNSVNNAFLVQMKQLKKSISTTVFTLDLAYGDNILYSSKSLIDLDNHVITYYVPTGMLTGKTEFTIDKIVTANTVSSKPNNNDKFTLNVGENESVFRVVAEDDTVFASYSINIIEFTPSFNIVRNGSGDVPYKDGNVVINLSSPVSSESTQPLPLDFDITPYLYLVDENGKVIDQYNNSKYTYFSLSPEDGDHIVDKNGNSIITISIDKSLPAGTYKLYISIYGTYGTDANGKYVEFTKAQSSEAKLTNVKYNGSEVIFTNNEAISYIPFGRCFSQKELIKMEYLDELPTISDGATYEITVNHSTNTDDECMTYTVTYTIIAENGTTNTYIHKLVENTPFVENGTGVKFATLYKDGSSVGDYTYQINKDNTLKDSYDRSADIPTYRVKYEMSYFYTLGNIEYSHNELVAGVSANTVDSGLSMEISEMADVGSYTFTYIYSSTGAWSNDEREYTRVYHFPSVEITKQASKDASFSRITFLDSSIQNDRVSTIINPKNSIRPVNNIPENEVYYESMFSDPANQKIEIVGKTINYHGYDTVDNSDKLFTNDFYVLGSIANAELSYYAPTFAIEEHAEVYQYTTLNKLTNYGNNQTKSDAEILNENSNTIYLYVPYTDGTNIEIFMVKSVNGQWTTVYSTDYDGKNENSNIASINGKNSTFNFGGSTFSLDESAGKPTSNKSLYMDYIGTPAQDHFWYVSYIVMSEDYLTDTNIGTDKFNNVNYKHYHVSLIDLTNNIYYNVSIKAPTAFDLQSLYITFAYNSYNKKTVDGVQQEVKSSGQISAYASKDATSLYEGFSSYSLNTNMQILPNGYYYFYVDLPEGYSARCYITNDKENRNIEGKDTYKDSEKGAYLPPSSIVTQKVNILIEIYSNVETDGKVWGVATQTVYTRQIKFEGLYTESSENKEGE